MLPPLSYSSHHAAFHLIVRAVGHHILQLLVLVDVSQWHHIARSGTPGPALFTSWAVKCPKPDFGPDSILFAPRMNSQNSRKPLIQVGIQKKPFIEFSPVLFMRHAHITPDCAIKHLNNSYKVKLIHKVKSMHL